MKSASPVKTVRFTEVVKRCGAPEPHLVLVAPPQDKILQTAVKANRVMTLFQATTGNKVDYGSVGFEKGASRQFLIFPKSLRPFADRKIVGIKYDLFAAAKVPKDQQARPAKSPEARKPKPPKRNAPLKPVKEKSRKPKTQSSPAKIIPFETHDDHKGEDSPDLRQARKLARQAMDALEDGKQVAAFNLLKRILAL